jgi:CubicO group peptidase (beta-lactamase class C family)
LTRLFLRLLSLVDESLIAACLLAAVLAGCASPVPPGSPGPIQTSALSGPRFTSGGPDAEGYGASNGYPVGDRTNWYQIPFLVGSYSHLDQILESRLIRRATTASQLARVASEPALHYAYAGKTLTLDDYLARNPTTGLIIARGDALLVERYQYARNDRHRFTSWSIAKIVTAMLVGIAIAEGRIRSVDDPAAVYVSALAGTEYGRTPLRHLLQMSSGVRFDETYSGRDDLTRLLRETIDQVGPGGVDAVKPYNERVRPSGTVSSYASAETQVLGLVLRHAVRRPIADYLQEKIWGPIGAEADATWLIDRSGQEATWCCLNAVLRDYARLGMLLAHGGNWRGRQLIPADWIEEATRLRPDQPHLLPGVADPFFGYGYQVRIFPGIRRTFAVSGAHGQWMFVDPASRLVMVHTAVRKQPVDPGERETVVLWRSVVLGLGNN